LHLILILQTVQPDPNETHLVTYSKSSVVPLPQVLKLPLKPFEDIDCWEEEQHAPLQFSSHYSHSVKKSSLSSVAKSRSFKRRSHAMCHDTMASPIPAPSMPMNPVPVAGGDAPLEGNALFLLSSKNKLRQLLYDVRSDLLYQITSYVH
jgi:hypothetical protein